MVWIKWLGLMPGVLALMVVGLNTYGARRWAANTQALLSRLESARVAATASGYDACELDGLPLPVQRYFGAALKGE